MQPASVDSLVDPQEEIHFISLERGCWGSQGCADEHILIYLIDPTFCCVSLQLFPEGAAESNCNLTLKLIHRAQPVRCTRGSELFQECSDVGLYASTIALEVPQGLAEFSNSGLHQDLSELVEAQVSSVIGGVVEGSSGRPPLEL